MIESSGAISDEEFSRRLLAKYLANQGKSGFRYKVNSNDPPDLLVTWDDGSQWGVEVRRTYEEVASGIVRLTGSDLKNLQLRALRLQVDATRPGRRLGFV